MVLAMGLTFLLSHPSVPPLIRSLGPATKDVPSGKSEQAGELKETQEVALHLKYQGGLLTWP